MLFREFITESLPVFLIEYNRRKTMENFKTPLNKRISGDTKLRARADDEDVLEKLEKADPTSNKQYVQWMVKAYINGSELEDLFSRGWDNLEKFEILKKKKLIKPEHADIGRFKNLKDLEDAVEQYEIPEREDVDKGDSSVIEDSKDFKAIVPHNEKAACYYGQGTRWCTAAKNNNMFKEYDGQNDLIIIIPKKPKYAGEKYQLHYGEDSEIIMDEKDEYVTEDSFIKRFSITHEDVTRLFAKALSGDDMKDVQKDETINRLKNQKLTPQRAFVMLRKHEYSDQDTEDLEKVLIADIKLTRKYLDWMASSDRKRTRSWSDFEKNLLAQGNQGNIVLYVETILNKRWPEAEKFLLSDPHIEHIYDYAVNSINKRWLEAEEVMLKTYVSEINEPNDNGYLMARYAQLAMKSYWPEFEKMILKFNDYETAGYYVQKSIDFRKSPNYEDLEQLARNGPYTKW